jgi:S-DNA-T family DNA segregation ATPase FtsK/SpoIIIE
VILDQAGAESLLGQGDMLFKPLGTSRLQRVQGAFVTEDEIALIVEQCRAQRGQELDESLLEAPEATSEADGGDEDFDPDEDPLLEKAIEVVVQTQTASVSLLQRRLRVGYTTCWSAAASFRATRARSRVECWWTRRQCPG